MREKKKAVKRGAKKGQKKAARIVEMHAEVFPSRIMITEKGKFKKVRKMARAVDRAKGMALLFCDYDNRVMNKIGDFFIRRRNAANCKMWEVIGAFYSVTKTGQWILVSCYTMGRLTLKIEAIKGE